MAEKFYVCEVTPDNRVVRRRIYIGTARGAKAWASRRFYDDALLELVTCDGVLVARRINGRWKNGRKKMSMNIKVFIDGEEVNVPQSSTEDTLDILNSEDRKQAVIEWLERINEKFLTWRFDRDAIERLSDAEKELFDRVMTAYYYTVDENEANSLLRRLNETLGTTVVEQVEKGWCDDLIERIRKSENVKVVMT